MSLLAASPHPAKDRQDHHNHDNDPHPVRHLALTSPRSFAHPSQLPVCLSPRMSEASRAASIDPDTFSKMFRSVVRATGLDGVRLHDLRHGFASMLVSAGTNVRVVSDLLAIRRSGSRCRPTRRSSSTGRFGVSMSSVSYRASSVRIL